MDVRQIPKASGDLPKSSFNASLSKLMTSATTGTTPDLETHESEVFIPARAFEGKRPGYVFTTGSKGTGYYIDKELSRENREALRREMYAQSKLNETASAQVMNSEELLRQAEEATRSKRTTLDGRSLKKLVGSFQKKYKENLEQRMKYPNEPEKFMDSEVDLDDIVQELFQIVNNPELYPIVVETGVIADLLNLLVHENRDIAADVIQLIASLTDTTDNEEFLKPFQTFVTCLLENNVIDLLIQHLGQLTENTDEEAAVVFNLLTALDNMIDVLPYIAKLTSQHKQFVKWLLHRLSQPEFDSVKQICGEMLVELLQHDSQSLLEINGTKVVFRTIQSTISTEPKSEDELEMFDNLFDALCCCILDPQAKETFVETGGVEMTLDIMKKRKAMRISALRVLEFTTTKSSTACRRLLEAFGLKTVFAFFMKKLSVGGKKEAELEQKADEMIVTIVSNLLEGLNEGPGYERVAAKFVENEFEKCDRLLELYFLFDARVTASKEELRSESSADPEEYLALRLDAGLAALQHICLIICHLWATSDKALRQRLLLLLHQKGHTLHNIKCVLSEMIEMMGGDEVGDHRSHLKTLAASLDGERPDDKTILSKDELKRRIERKRKSKRQKTDDAALGS